MKAVFIHDHRFPVVNGIVYESSGFDLAFVNRYIELFEKVSFIGRKAITNKPLNKKYSPLNKSCDFILINSLHEIAVKKNRDKIIETIKQSDYAIIRLPSILGVYGISLCIKYHIPYLVEMVGCPWDAISTRGGFWILPAYFLRKVTEREVKRAEYVLYVSEQFLQNKYPTNGRQVGCSDVMLSELDSSVIKTRLKKIKSLNKNDTIVIGTCATLASKYKNQELVIRSMAKSRLLFSNFRYEIVGDGDCSYLKSLVKKLNLEEQVIFKGELDHQSVFEWLNTIDIYVHPSRLEGLCRAIIEAMSCGCPVIASDAGGIHEQIQDRYIFKNNDEKDFIRVINGITKEELKRMANYNFENCKKYCTKRLDKLRKDFVKEFIMSK